MDKERETDRKQVNKQTERQVGRGKIKDIKTKQIQTHKLDIKTTNKTK